MNTTFDNRIYRNFQVTGTVPFQVTLGQSDLFIRADSDLSKPAAIALATVRGQLESYIEDNPLFDRSLLPLHQDPIAPRVVRTMLAAGLAANVGPMAAVAGAIAQEVGRELMEQSSQVIVENGGDLFLKLAADQLIGIFAGNSLLSGKVGLRISADQTPCGLCTSSGTVGHSHSEGKADAVVILAEDAGLADAAATAVGNIVKSAVNIQTGIDHAKKIKGVLGVCIIIKDKLGIWGKLTLEKIN